MAARTLKLPFTDDLFTALRNMYNDRALVQVFARISFCLLGVATANELIKDRRTTPYNIGETLTLRDFDANRDDLAPLAAVLHEDIETANALLTRVLHWSGGHPYLTRLGVGLFPGRLLCGIGSFGPVEIAGFATTSSAQASQIPAQSTRISGCLSTSSTGSLGTFTLR